jgi:cellulose synthase/poly-beta-1,6-N-acetylglucosamine synthase-like glycosyltransferase
MREKRATLILLPLLAWLGLAFGIVWPWMRQFDMRQPVFSILAHANAAIWWVVLLWVLHHLTFQLKALFSNISPHIQRSHRPLLPTVALLYLTCDDFDEECCLSCIRQDYEIFRFYICDDSTSPEYIERVQQFADTHGCCRVTRPTRQGFKAGNINHFLRNYTAEDWFLLVDADQLLPKTFLQRLVEKIPSPSDESIIFIQGAHNATNDEKNSEFQRVLGPEVTIFYDRDLAPRERFGFVPMLGHGVLIRTANCLNIGGFPEIVSEDFAFALRAARHGKRGIYAEDVVSSEAYPYDFGAFMTRLKKFASGSAELMRHEFPSFLGSTASWIEKWDFILAILLYVLMPLLVLNGFLSAYVVHTIFSSSSVPYFHPALPYIYSWLFVALFSLSLSVTKSFGRALRFYFWSNAIYTASFPVAGWYFLKHLFTRPNFQRTPKNRRKTGLSVEESFLMACLGIGAIACAFVWLSPFSPALIAQGVAFLSYRLYAELSSSSVMGKIARLSVPLPGILYLFALYAMWQWGC